MSSPTRQEIIDAYEMLDVLLGYSEDRNPDLVPERRSIIEKALPPRPQATMAEVEWDDDKHYLAEAEHQYCGEVIMLGPDEGGLIEFFVPKLRASRYDAAYPGSLTLTGRRYTLTEVQE
jgi:hypothetical protein